MLADREKRDASSGERGERWGGGGSRAGRGSQPIAQRSRGLDEPVPLRSGAESPRCEPALGACSEFGLQVTAEEQNTAWFWAIFFPFCFG